MGASALRDPACSFQTSKPGTVNTAKYAQKPVMKLDATEKQYEVENHRREKRARWISEALFKSGRTVSVFLSRSEQTRGVTGVENHRLLGLRAGRR